MALSKLSLLAEFDDIGRGCDILYDGSEKEYLKFVESYQALLRKNARSDNENRRLLRELAEAQSKLETLRLKNEQARQLLDREIYKKKKFEQERDLAEQKLKVLAEILLSDKNHFDPETREKLSFLQVDRERRSRGSPSKHDRLDVINELNSTGSILDDLSLDQTDEDLDADTSRLRNGRQWKRRTENDHEKPDTKRKRSGRSSTRKSEERILDDEDASHIVSVTTVSVPKEGPITATAKLEAIKNANNRRRSRSEPREALKPSAPLIEDMSDSDSSHLTLTRTYTPQPHRRASSTATPISTTPSYLRTMSSAGRLNNRLHSFTSKTTFKTETCTQCGKKIGFGKNLYKCSDCKASVHPECKVKLPLPCIPTATTPCKKDFSGILADYAPDTSPMIPALIVHCINEVEKRGLNEQGIYRVNGAETQVRELKEKFLKGRGIPNVSSYDVHVLCSTIKTFLRDLKEPLITFTLWQRFVNAAETLDELDMQTSLYSCVAHLPRPNRDTLSFLILHLHRVAESPACNMPLDNLAKVFSQTVIGYSSPDPDPSQMLSQTRRLQNVMEKLLTIPSDYWEQYAESNGDTLITPNHATPAYSTRGQRGSIASLSDTPIGAGIRSYRRPQQYFTSPHIN